MQNNLIAKALISSISSNQHEREEALNFLLKNSKKNGFISSLLQIILVKQTDNNEMKIKKLASIQLKNSVANNLRKNNLFKTQQNHKIEYNFSSNLENQKNFIPNKNWTDEDGETFISEEEKFYLKNKIFEVFLFENDIKNIKIYLKIVYKILKYEENWIEFFPKVLEFLDSPKQELIYFGLLFFIQLLKICLYSIKYKNKFNFQDSFGIVYASIEKILFNIFDVILISNLLSDNENYLIMNRILSKILKIFSTSFEVIF